MNPYDVVDMNGDPDAAPAQDLPGDNLFCLIAGRHPIPGDPPALLAGWDFGQHLPHPQNLQQLVDTVDDVPYWFPDLGNAGVSASTPINLVVTGLTPALIWALNWLTYQYRRPYVVLWHHDRDTGLYYPQPAPTWFAHDLGVDRGKNQPAPTSSYADYDDDWDDNRMPPGAKAKRGGW